MPSPVGHSLIGLAIAGAALLPVKRPGTMPRERRRWFWPLLGCLFLANAPDLDYIPGIISGDLNAYHHYYTHTVGWCVLAAGMAWALLRAGGKRVALGAFSLILLLLLSHIAADYITDDRRAPYGVMFWWPFWDEFVISPVTIFPHLKKATYAEFLQMHNLFAVLMEIAWCVPLLLAAGAFRVLRAK